MESNGHAAHYVPSPDEIPSDSEDTLSQGGGTHHCITAGVESHELIKLKLWMLVTGLCCQAEQTWTTLRRPHGTSQSNNQASIAQGPNTSLLEARVRRQPLLCERVLCAQQSPATNIGDEWARVTSIQLVKC